MADDPDYWQNKDLNVVKRELAEDEPPSTTNMPVELQQQPDGCIRYDLSATPTITPEIAEDDAKLLEEARDQAKYDEM